MVERASDSVAGGLTSAATATPPSALPALVASGPPPSRVGGFRLLNELGAGGMGRVYRARQESVGREVALKLLDPALAREPGFSERFMREAKAMAMINHPQVVACFDAGVDQGRCYLALELVPGGDCSRLAKRRGGRLVIADVVRIGIDCARGLEAIEAAGLIHRDIKPANIFLTDDPALGGRAKLGDLGLVRACVGEARVTNTGAALGTPAYMAPEQARGEKNLDIRADIYALGATLFELATGEPPFSGETAYAVVSQVLSGKVPDPRRLNPEISVAFSAILLHAMARTAAERFASPREFREDLERLAAGELPLAFSRSLGGNLATGMLTRPGPAPAREREAPGRPGVRMHPWLIPGILVTVMMVVAAVVALNPGAVPADGPRPAVPEGTAPGQSALSALSRTASDGAAAVAAPSAAAGGVPSRPPAASGADALASTPRAVWPAPPVKPPVPSARVPGPSAASRSTGDAVRMLPAPPALPGAGAEGAGGLPTPPPAPAAKTRSTLDSLPPPATVAAP